MCGNWVCLGTEWTLCGVAGVAMCAGEGSQVRVLRWAKYFLDNVSGLAAVVTSNN